MIRFWFFIVSVPSQESPHIAGFSFLLESGLDPRSARVSGILGSAETTAVSGNPAPEK